MADSGPVDGRHPTLPGWIIGDHAFHPQRIRLTVIVRVIAVGGAHESNYHSEYALAVMAIGTWPTWPSFLFAERTITV
jgi:hypothetical protein